MKKVEVGQMKSGRAEDPVEAGRVNAVCKEWLVREDSALAYRLQSEEIHDHYKGNRNRNGQVRQDFPTALQEQIKEKENAERQAAVYHQMINEQEEADAHVARELTEKLEREVELERRRLLRKSEQIARQLQHEQMQRSVANELPIPPRSNRINGGVPPPQLPPSSSRNLLADQMQLSPVADHHPSDHQASQSRAAAALELNYACLDLPQNQRINNNNNKSKDANSTALYDTIFNVIEDPTARRNLLLKHTPEKAVPYNVSSSSSSCHDQQEGHGGAKQKQRPQRYSEELAIDVDLQNRNYQKLSPAKYDLLMGNDLVQPQPSAGNSRRGGNSSFDSQEEMAEIESLKILGLPADELKEMGRRARQERIDEELARKLQEQMVKDEMSQEEKDRMVALEAQDKELARMLQEREKAKAKRAKERARLKKLQREQERMAATEDSHLLNDSYANPMDLLQQPEGAEGEDYPETSEDNYSHPVDYLRQQQPQQMLQGAQGGKLLRDQRSIEELYAQPISKRPNKLELKGPLNRPAPAKAHLPDYPENIATVIDPTYAQLQPLNGDRERERERDAYQEEDDRDRPLPPPYMPIQGIRRQQPPQGGGAGQYHERLDMVIPIPQNYSRMAEQKGGGGGRNNGSSSHNKKNKEKCAQQ